MKIKVKKDLHRMKKKVCNQPFPRDPFFVESKFYDLTQIEKKNENKNLCHNALELNQIYPTFFNLRQH